MFEKMRIGMRLVSLIPSLFVNDYENLSDLVLA